MSLPVNIEVHEVKQLLDAGNIVLVDCREESEWNTAKIEGAILMPLSRWQDASAKLSEFEGQHVVVHCHHGGRSLRATQWLRENGFPEAQNMAGGIDQWSREIDNSVPQY